jgi:hypothetical protein
LEATRSPRYSLDTDRWNFNCPAELAGYPNLKFQPGVAVYPRPGGLTCIYAVTTDGRLAQLWDTPSWRLDFPAEAAGFRDLRFLPDVAVYPREGGTKKSIYVVTTGGRLAQLWDTDHWNLDFPVEAAGARELRFY